MQEWIWKPYQNLTLNELYGIIHLREKVFVEEQTIVYTDADYKDQSAWHLFKMDSEERVIAYLRVLPPTKAGGDFRIGRVVTATSVRGQGLGKVLIKEGLAHIVSTWGKVPVSMAAQAYLERFYQGLDFETVSEPYILEDILHIEMRWNVPAEEDVNTV